MFIFVYEGGLVSTRGVYHPQYNNITIAILVDANLKYFESNSVGRLDDCLSVGFCCRYSCVRILYYLQSFWYYVDNIILLLRNIV